ncbi:hypothetical protein ACFVHW_16650 [Streptomyces sp. NPDC127110]|uniref:hypothetical protein n=1 Tax=Streptomyces sp. NPDC127110 TaxID=3345362 RepID=UPI003639DBAF
MATPYDQDLVELLADASFDRFALTGSDPAAWAYASLRHITSALGDGKPLLADHRRLRDLLELTAMADPVLFHVMFLHHCMTIGPALDYGAHAADIAELTSARSVGAALMTELGLGSSSANIRTRATYDAATREFVLDTPDPAAAKYPPNVGLPGLPRLAVVSARVHTAGVDRGTFLFLVPLQDTRAPHPGVRICRRPPTALLPLDYATVSFEGVRVPRHRWLADGADIDSEGVFHDPLADPAARTGRSLGMSRFACGAVTGCSPVAGRRRVVRRPRTVRAVRVRQSDRQPSVGPPASGAWGSRNSSRLPTGSWE